MAITADSIMPSITPYIGPVLDVIIQFIVLIFILVFIGYGFMLYMFSIKLNIREYSKGGRVIVSTTRAKKIIDKTTGAPKLMMFNVNPMIIFGLQKGVVINEPPSECLVPYKSRITNKLYDFVKKDGMYYPVQNFVLGYKHEVIDEKTGKKSEVWNLKGSGLEISRDYDVEQAIQNTLIEKATVYRNRKPTEIVASFALMIITIVVSGVVMYFAWNQFGNMAQAIASLREPLREGIMGAAQSIVGPG